MTGTSEAETWLDRDHRRGSNHLLILVLLALGVRTIVYFNTYLISLDAAYQYIPMAKAFSRDDFLQALKFSQSPVFTYSIHLLQKIVGDYELSGRLVALIFGTLTVFPVYLLGRKAFGARLAFMATLMFIIHPYLVRNSVDIVKESTFLFFFFSSIYFGWLALTEKKSHLFILPGLTGSIAMLTRADGSEVMILVFLWIIFPGLIGQKMSAKRKAVSVFLFILPVLFMAGPYLWYIHHVTGKWNVSFGKNVSHLILGDQADSLKEYLYALGFLANKIIKQVHPLYLLLLLGGVIRRRVFPYRRFEFYLLSFIIIHFLIIYFLVLNYSSWENGRLMELNFSGRHTLPLLMVSLYWVGMGIFETADRVSRWRLWKERRGNRAFSKKLVILSLLIILAIVLPKTLKPQRLDKIGRKEAGIWIKENGPPNPVLMTDMMRAAYYADGKFIKLSWDLSYEKLLQRAGKKGVHYMVVNERNVQLAGSDLLKVINEKDWEDVYTSFERYRKSRYKIVVYKLNRQPGG